MQTKQKKILYFVIFALLLIAILVLLITWAVRKNRAEPIAAPAPVTLSEEPDVRVVYKEKEVEKMVEVEKVITGDIIQDGLNDMGFLVTQEYWFTEVMQYNSIKSVLGFDLGITESSFLASYDGVVTAGVDFSAIRVSKDEEQKTVLITMPNAVIQNTTIDNDSFQLYSEKEGLGNNISIKDFNVSVAALKDGAEQKAIDRGVLERANENAETLVKDFVCGLVDVSQYNVIFTTA